MFDNGSLRAAATLSLRELAQRLESTLPVPVRAVSLLHSSGVDPRELGGRPAQLLEPALLDFARNGGRHAILLPLFFGPSAALTEYVPGRVQAIRRQCPALEVQSASWLVREDDDSTSEVAEMLAEAVRAVRREHGLTSPHVILADHGSPQPAVTAVRNALGAELREKLGPSVESVRVASMERRPGEQYRFNEPLLAEALRSPDLAHSDVIIALQFLQSGRHAGPAGDIAGICREAQQVQPAQRTYLTEPVVTDPRLLRLLQRRFQETLRSVASAQSIPPPAHSA